MRRDTWNALRRSAPVCPRPFATAHRHANGIRAVLALSPLLLLVATGCDTAAASAASEKTGEVSAHLVVGGGPFSIVGTIVGPTSAPIAGAVIQLGGSLQAQTVSNASGAYSFSGLGAGNYSVGATLAGCAFGATRNNIIFANGQTTATVTQQFQGTATGSGSVCASTPSSAGPAGPPGPQGPAGAVGPTGPAGAQGPAGPAGADGAPGPIGPIGPMGLPGPQGLQGVTGPGGPSGPQGPAGATGAQGPAGAAGATGPAGPAGPAGPTGATGPAGPTGNGSALDGLFGDGGPSGFVPANQPPDCLIGQILLLAFAGGAPVTSIGGTALAAGQLLPINQNQALFAVLGTNFGGDGVSTFALPDLRAQAPNGTGYVICIDGIFPSRN
jgi:hypothetical protein